jgi:hypothetical protein
MKKLALVLSLAMVMGVFAANAQEKKVAPKKPATEQTTKAPAEKKEVKKDAKVKKAAPKAAAEKKAAPEKK